MKNKYTHQCAVPIILCLLITFNSSPIFSQDQPKNRITGVVSDEAGPLLGASILIKNTSQGTVSDQNGFYEIMAQPSDTLIFSYIGLISQELPVNLQKELHVTLHIDETSLDEVVINAGYYKVSDRERTGSISRITAEEIEKQPVSNPLEALQGRITGVDVIQNSGISGGGFKVRVRGQNSLMAGNEPLYIIDGVPYDTQSLDSQNTSGRIIPNADVSPLNAINPESIESIEILKDADATAIYGSRGANGVILITTKKGKEGKTSFIVSSSTGISHVGGKIKLLNTEQYLEVRKEAFVNDGIFDYPDWAYDVNGTWDTNRYTDWQKELIGGTSNSRKISTQVSGGSSNTNFLVSGQFQKESTVFPQEYNYDRLTVNNNLNHQSQDKRFKIVFTSGYSLEKNNLPSMDLTSDAISLPPNAPALYNDEGNLNWENSTWTNPFAQLESTYNQNTNSLLSNSVLSYSISDDFEAKINAGYGFSLLKSQMIYPHSIYDPAYGVDSDWSSIIRNLGVRKYWVTEPQIQWKKKAKNSSWNILLGMTFQNLHYGQESIMGKGFPTNDLINNMSAANTVTILNENKTNYKYHSLFGRVNYEYQNRFFLNITGRRDGSSRFGSKNKYGNFGALGAAWVFKVRKNNGWIDSGKLRGSYGLIGNDQIGDYQYLQTYSIEDYPYDNNIGLVPTRLYNPKFKWEKIIKREIAVELGIIDSKLMLLSSYYNNRSSNQLVRYSLPGTTGFQNIQANLNAEIENSGLELELQSSIFQKKNFSWDSSLNFSLPKNKLLSFPDLETSSYSNRYVIGESINIVKLYELEGVDPETGIFKFKDFNGDGVISSDQDRQYKADLSPKFFGGFNNTIRFKGWAFNFFLQFVKKYGYNQYRYTEPPGMMSNHSLSVLDRWQHPGDKAAMQRYTTGENYEAYLAYSRFIQSNGVISDASYIKLRSIDISYTLMFDQKAAINSCRVFLQGLNLLTFTNYKGGDPEQNTGFIPPQRKIMFGVQLYL